MTAAEEIRYAARILEVVSVDSDDEITSSQQDAARHLSGVCEVLADSVEAMQDAELVTDGGVTHLHYANPRPKSERHLHVDPNCAQLTQASSTKTVQASERPTGRMCDNCAPDRTREEMLPPQPNLPDACEACGYAMVGVESDRWWQRTPQGRPKCPDCGAIPHGYELASRQEVPADD